MFFERLWHAVVLLSEDDSESLVLVRAHQPFVELDIQTSPCCAFVDDRMLVGSIERELLKQVVNDQLTMDRKFDYFSNKLKQQNQKPSSPTSAPEHNYDVNSNISSNDQQVSQLDPLVWAFYLISAEIH